ncbi:hypothetical protein MTR_0142s0010 [Medicago truncatula]|uniref:Uncharacterized protein n=1 Tax=Medicago truncatula TaxID=3880 RepID=A0A072TG79_MEDTR|nr:hypothetical protein MTR_0142s0010 [Medicago truncatula]
MIGLKVSQLEKTPKYSEKKCETAIASEKWQLPTVESATKGQHDSNRFVCNSLHGKNIGWIESWSKRKELGADSVRKYEDSETKICLPKVRSLAQPVLALARPCHLPESLLLLLLIF